ncbi:MAG: ATP-binding protein [Hydrogenobacter sp.]|uniref:ATP-binding protein n=1 Tax=Hydrogenobacter thermophilus TaxID=940 RepID=UPI0030F8BECE
MGIDFENALAFRFKDGKLQPILQPHIPDFETLLHIDKQKEELRKNTLKLVKGLPAHDALLWGDRGTGKSSLVKSMLGLFGKDGLRMVQIYQMDIIHISDLYELLRGTQKKFILFFDDLSFEHHDEQVNILKSLLDGDVEERPPNVVVYVTSNRRNLMEESEREEKFPEEGRIQVVSLVERFGIRLGFFSFGKREYLDIVKNYVKIKGLSINEEELTQRALKWASQRQGFSGRTAYQFVRDLEGELMLKSYKWLP